MSPTSAGFLLTNRWRVLTPALVASGVFESAPQFLPMLKGLFIDLLSGLV